MNNGLHVAPTDVDGVWGEEWKEGAVGTHWGPCSSGSLERASPTHGPAEWMCRLWPSRPHMQFLVCPLFF